MCVKLIEVLQRSTMTAVSAFTTSRNMCPPMLIYPLERMTFEIRLEEKHYINFEKKTYKRLQYKRRKIQAEAAFRRRIDVLEGT